jgi:hypothetical protein
MGTWKQRLLFIKGNRLHKGGYTVSCELLQLALGKMAQGAEIT